MRGMTTLPQGNQELLVVRDKIGRPPGELGVSKSMEFDIFPSVLWHCWLVDRKGIRPVKKLDVGLLVVVIWLELCTTCSSSPVVTTTSIIGSEETQRLRAGGSKVEPKTVVPLRTPFPGGTGWPKFNQLEIVTTFTYKPSLVRIDARNFELSW